MDGSSPARWLSGEPVAGDDALEARFVPLGEVEAVITWSETRRIIAEAVRHRQDADLTPSP